MRLLRRGKRPEPVDLYDEESLNATEYAHVCMRLSDLEARLADLEYLAEFGQRREAAGQLALPGVA